MMYTNNNNNNLAFVCGVNTTNINALAGTTLEVSDIANGDVVLVNTENEVLADSDRTAQGEDFKIATRLLDESGVARLYYSPAFNMANVTITSGKSSAAAQQVTNIGGTTAGTGGYLLPNVASDDTIAATEVGNSFYVLIEKQDNDEANRSGYAPAITAQVKMSSASGSDTFTFTTAEELQVNLGAQLREAIAKNDALEVDRPATAGPKYVRAKVVANVATQANITGGANNATFVFGSKTVTTSANCEAGIDAADYLNVAGDLYKIASDPGTGQAITLEDPYRGPSATFVTGTGAAQCGFSTAAQVNAATCIGVQLEGQAQHSFNVARDRIHSESRFNARFAKDGENVGAAITLTTAATEGLGSYEQVAYEEYHSMGQTGLRWVSDIPGQVRPGNATVDKNYGCVRLSEVRTENRGLVSGFTSRKQANIWIELQDDGTTVTDANDVQHVLLTQLNVGVASVDRS